MAAKLPLVMDAQGHPEQLNVGDTLITPPNPNFGAYNDVYEFGEGGEVENKFVKSAYSHHTSLDSTAIALSDGEVVNVTISTEEKPENNFFLQIIRNATKAGSGTFKGGVQTGTDIEKPVGQLDVIVTNLVGFTFLKGDRIAVYIKKGTEGGKEAKEPVIRVFVRYD